MHMQGEPRTMQDHPQYDDVVAEVSEFLVHEREECVRTGIAREAIALDPGLGFGKGLGHNLTLLKFLTHFAALGSPLLVGVSHKSFIASCPAPQMMTSSLCASAARKSWSILCMRSREAAT